MRCLEGADPENILTRVAFIEKTPRIRIAEYTGEKDEHSIIINDWKNWRQGPKGSGGGNPPVALTYGFDPKSRAWCDEQLKAMGYILG